MVGTYRSWSQCSYSCGATSSFRLTSTIIVGTAAPLSAILSQVLSEVCGPRSSRRRAGGTLQTLTSGTSYPSLDQHLVDVAPSPVFPWLQGSDYGVLGRVEVLCGVAIGALIATAHVPTDKALPEMNPGVVRPQTFFAALRRGLNVLYLARVAAPLSLEHMDEPPHRCSPQAGRLMLRTTSPPSSRTRPPRTWSPCPGCHSCAGTARTARLYPCALRRRRLRRGPLARPQAARTARRSGVGPPCSRCA